MVVVQSEILAVLLGTFLEYLIGIVGYLALAVLHTPASEPTAMAIHRVGLHTTVEIHDVVVVEHVIIVDGGTHIPAKHIVVCALIDTTIWQYRDRQSIYIVWVGIEISVVLYDGGSAHRPVGQGLVAVIEDIVLLAGRGVLGGC